MYLLLILLDFIFNCSEFYSTPIISLVHEEGSASAIRGANVSCSVYIRSRGNSTLIFQCNGGSDHLENMGDTDGSHITSSLYIPVQSDYSWVKCTCVLKYMSEGHIRNQTITQRLTLRGKHNNLYLNVWLIMHLYLTFTKSYSVLNITEEINIILQYFLQAGLKRCSYRYVLLTIIMETFSKIYFYWCRCYLVYYIQ